MATFVLVHGACHGGWCYARVRRALILAGHEVFTPTLTGLGERSHLSGPNINLETHITDILNVIKWEGLNKVVLCGHSYGGIVITGVADAIPDQIDALVYLDAVLPEDGNSAFDLASQDRQETIRRAVQEEHVCPALDPPYDVGAWWGVNEKDRDWVQGKVTSHPLATLLQPIKLRGAYKAIQRYYVYSKGVPATAPYYERCLADPQWIVSVIEGCGHDQMIDDPEAVVKVLLLAANGRAKHACS